MRVAITGGSGFIGQRLVSRHLAAGDEICVLSRRSPDQRGGAVRWFYGDLGGSDDLRAFVAGADILYHCAGEIHNESRMETVHLIGTSRLIEAASGRVGRWVQLSSAGAYGRQREGLVTECTELNPQGRYEATKTESDFLVSAASAAGAFPHVILRPAIVYGANMPNRSLYGLISMIRRGWFFFIGRSGASANYVHADNVVDALMLCGKHSRAVGEVYNLSDHRTIEQFVAGIAGLLQCPVPRFRLPEMPVRALSAVCGTIPGFPLPLSRVDALTCRAVYSTAKIERELGYRHIRPMEAGLADLVSFWQREHDKTGGGQP